MAFQRYVALGDSFTEGVGDHDPQRPHGVRGWADRVAEVLAARADEAEQDFGYANLAIRGRKLRAVVAEQIEPAVALGPDLITIYAGANDILRPRVDLDALLAEYDGAVRRLVGTGARVVLFTAFDPGGSGLYRPIRGRFALYNELLREIADETGASIVDFWRIRDHKDWRLWDEDRMHMSALGHHRVAMEVLDVLGIPHDLEPTRLDDDVAPAPRVQQLRENVAWAREYLVPWVHRRVTGRSSGDNLSPRYPAYGRPEPV